MKEWVDVTYSPIEIGRFNDDLKVSGEVSIKDFSDDLKVELSYAFSAPGTSGSSPMHVQVQE
ncbi:MAG: hypothetical protein ACI9MC_002050 [Kiritimatiellia bacterium]